MLSCFTGLSPLGMKRTLRAFSTSVPVVELILGRERKFFEGNPIVYDGAIKKVYGSPLPGDIVHVSDSNRNIIGKGFFNPHSMYRVRITALKSEPEFDMSLEELLYSRLNQAIDKREALSLPSSRTSAYRMVNGEGDKLSGLTIDVLGNRMIAQPSALWVESHANIVKNVLSSYADMNKMQLQWKRQLSHLKQDGFVPSSSENEPNSLLLSDSINTGTVLENGLKYCLDAADQKTGFYCDQRDNRLLLRPYCKDKTVLDLYCYTGGFALNAVAGGAKSVLAVDSSQPALDCAEKNRVLNGMDPDKIEFRKGDCDAVMKSLVGSRFFDVVVCDPPKLAPNRASLNAAIKKYRHLNTLAMQLIEPSGGMLLTCSCSAAMTQSNGFLDVLRDAAEIAGRKIQVLKVLGAGPDHPVLPAYPEGKYLTAVLLRVE